MSIRETIKRLFEPVRSVPKSYSFFIIAEAFDVFQSIFVIQLGFYILQAIENKNQEDVIFWGILLGIFFVITHLIALSTEVVFEYLGNKLYFYIKKKVLNQFIILDNSKIEKLGTGKIQNIVQKGLGSRDYSVRWGMTSIVFEIIGVIYAFILMVSQVPTLYHLLGLFSIFMIASLLMWKGLIILEKTRKESKSLELDMSRNDVKIIMSKVEILQNNKLHKELQIQEDLTNKQIALWQKGNLKKGLWQLGAGFLIDGLQRRILVIVGLGVILGEYQISYLMLMLQLLRTIERYIRQLRRNFQSILDHKTHLETLRDLLDNNKPLQKYTEGIDFNYEKGDIYIDHINFKYNDNDIFQNFSLKLKGGTKTAFVGESGGGKTTLIKLIAGYLRSDSGEIIIDGQKLSEIKLTNYYKHIGYLTQDPSVFDGTIYENLVYGLPEEITEGIEIIEGLLSSKISEVINLSKCEFIYDLPQGIHTEIGERGVRLSGGQKQRLAIAKIMLKNPNIILLDEPTSALDSFNEELVSEALHNLFQGKTVIVIAHRLQTVKNADRILYIDKGKVIEDGNHSELIALGGRYKRMLDLQSGF